jgi:hypothetical protein
MDDFAVGNSPNRARLASTEAVQQQRSRSSSPPRTRPNTIYEPLLPGRHEFRVLILRAGQCGTGQVRATLRLVRLEEATKPRYETISYCWGDSTQLDLIELSGHTISAPASSVEALERMRLPHRDRVLWIDALCINQADVDERSSQVAIMDRIFEDTIGNLIYLGEGDKTTASAVESIQHIHELYVKETNSFQALEGTPFELSSSTYSEQRRREFPVDCKVRCRCIESCRKASMVYV